MATGIVEDIEAESFLPMSLTKLCIDLERQIGTRKTMTQQNYQDRDDWSAFVTNMRAIISVHYDKVSNAVRDALEAMQAGDDRHEHMVKLGGNLRALLDATQYRMMNEDTFATAQEVDYEFDFPTYIDWNRFDPSYIEATNAVSGANMVLATPRTRPTTKEEQADWQQLSNRIRVYVRGVKQKEDTGRFFVQKINCFLDNIWNWRSPEKATQLDSPRTTAKGTPSVSRQTLNDIVLRKGFFSTFFKEVTIKEPAFEHVCTVWKDQPRTLTPKARDAKKLPDTSAANGKKKKKPKAQQKDTDGGDVQIHLFQDVPFGDLEAVLPHKVVQLKPLDTLVFAIKIVVAFVLLAITFNNLIAKPQKGERVKGTYLIVLLAIVALVKQAVGLITGWLSMRKGYERDVDRFVQRKQAAQGVPVVAQLVDEAKQQELKEMLLTYFFLWREEKPMTASAVDLKIERFLKQEYKEDLDFDERDGIEKLLSLGIITESGGAKDEPTYTVQYSPSEWVETHPDRPLTSCTQRFRTASTRNLDQFKQNGSAKLKLLASKALEAKILKEAKTHKKPSPKTTTNGKELPEKAETKDKKKEPKAPKKKGAKKASK
eukprot:TRINITY_DN14620_c1_g2_i1.p1 TRINITY_DN14620_c1_g2~~TRINITY_DN14620_c1_g2_i1.p1  ORF type:complete len:617 (+),score=137.24 TRINITY_DN14620_c1_g2_i1:56-1852(+)